MHPTQADSAGPIGRTVAVAKVSDRRSRSHWFHRVGDALRRRTRRAAMRRRAVRPGGSIEAAIEWLLRHQHTDGGFRRPRDGRTADVEFTAVAASVLMRFGLRAEADRAVAWLTDRAADDGSIGSAAGYGWLRSTARALDVLLGTKLDVSSQEQTTIRAAEYLASAISPSGHLPSGDDRAASRWGRATGHLTVLPALCYAAERFDRSDWRQRAERAAQRLRGQWLLDPWRSVDFQLIDELDALVQLEMFDAARPVLLALAANQRRDGAMPGPTGGRGMSTRAVAQLADVWLRAGLREPATRALEGLRDVQRKDGSLPELWPGTADANRSSPWATLYFLEAAWREATTAFREPGWHGPLPETVAADDPRLLAVKRWAAELPPNAKIADVGCGSGRYLTHLRQCLPRASFTGIDVAARSLSQLPPGVEARQGELLELPAGDGEFDAALSIEALEHSLLPRRAMAELCRVVRPGGRLLVIDKHRRWQALSHYAPWERWFEPAELSGWLGEACDHVRVDSLDGAGQNGPRPLFLSASGQRRAGQGSRVISWRVAGR